MEIRTDKQMDMLTFFDFHNFGSGARSSYATNSYVIGYPPGFYAFNGSGFTYNPEGRLNGGIITDFNYTGVGFYGVSGLHMPVASVFAASGTSDRSDDLAVIRAAMTGSDFVDGSEFSDRLFGWGGNDQILGGDGNDRIYGGDGSDRLGGNGGSDLVYGEAGNDLLESGEGTYGNDMLYGGVGNDVFSVDSAGDRVYEAAGQGTDTIYTWGASYALAAGQHVEVLATDQQKSLTAINLSGNEFAQRINGNNGVNVIKGNGGNDTISGFNGNDFLYGGAGNDRLAGGTGNDSFVFNTALNKTISIDTIADFNPIYDNIRLDNAVMAALGAKFEPVEFWKSTGGIAHDGNDRIIYETDTGWLNYDSNGSAAGGAVHIARLAPNLALTASDFFVI